MLRRFLLICMVTHVNTLIKLEKLRLLFLPPTMCVSYMDVQNRNACAYEIVNDEMKIYETAYDTNE